MSTILSTNDLAIGYPGRLVAEHLALDLNPGDVVVLVGPNGTGKTTLLRTLAGLLAPLAGSIALNGDPLARLSAREKAQRLGVVLTERPQTGYLTGFELAAAGRYPHTGWQGRLTESDVAIVDEALALVGATPFRDRPVASLSDGERQRVMVARALAQQPRLLLLDEVTSFLDVPRRVAFFALLGELAAQRGYAIVISTHELELALRCANRLWLYDGTKLLDGAPEDLILSGDFTRIFAADGVSFDEDAGHFELRRPASRRVALEGAGARAAWTRRALERSGFAVDPAASICVSVDATGWRIGPERAGSIAAMLGRLNDS
ncbi:MAG TPA: ABC transporter ATP-binding protein [Sphingopyxis sp.]|nr:ABC transporter ATP-binding protein [Sphingopyxis sp.]